MPGKHMQSLRKSLFPGAQVSDACNGIIQPENAHYYKNGYYSPVTGSAVNIELYTRQADGRQVTGSL